jgi:hypothetical protein
MKSLRTISPNGWSLPLGTAMTSFFSDPLATLSTSVVLPRTGGSVLIAEEDEFLRVPDRRQHRARDRQIPRGANSSARPGPGDDSRSCDLDDVVARIAEFIDGGAEFQDVARAVSRPPLVEADRRIAHGAALNFRLDVVIRSGADDPRCRDGSGSDPSRRSTDMLGAGADVPNFWW